MKISARLCWLQDQSVTDVSARLIVPIIRDRSVIGHWVHMLDHFAINLKVSSGSIHHGISAGIVSLVSLYLLEIFPFLKTEISTFLTVLEINMLLESCW